MPVSMFLAITLAPGTTAPFGSVTVPRIVPRKVCAESGATTNTTSKKVARPRLIFLSDRSGSVLRAGLIIISVWLLLFDIDGVLLVIRKFCCNRRNQEAIVGDGP